MKNLRLVIGIPSTQEWCADFGMSLAFLVARLSQQIPGFASQQYRIHNKRGSILARSRQKLVEEAIKGDATHLLFIDSDQTFPSDLVHRLLAHKKQVVGCNIATKMIPSTPTARLKDGTVFGKPLYTEADDTDLVKVWRLGTGIMMLDLNLFKRKGMEAPWFDQHWVEEIHDYMGEDWGFCEKLEAAGVSIYVDQDLSREIGHVGKLEYTHDLVEIKEETKSA